MNPRRTNHDLAIKVGQNRGPVTQTRNIVSLILFVIGIATSSQPSSAPSPDLQTYFQQSVGLGQDQDRIDSERKAGDEGAAITHAGGGSLVWRRLHPCCS
jgi:hypothetical protein